MTDIIVEGDIIKLPLHDKFQRIINFGYVSKEDIDIVANRKFHIVVKNGKEYVRSTDKMYLHELMLKIYL